MRKLSKGIIGREKTSNVGYRVWRICPICKKEFSRAESLKQEYCSIKCANIDQRGERHSQKTEFKKGQKPWNTGKKLPQWVKDKLSESHQITKKGKGKLHYNWMGGGQRYYSDIANRVYREHIIRVICEMCGTSKKIDIHHKDRKRRNNKKENLQALCHSCHLKTHHKEDRTENICKECGNIFYSGRRKANYCSTPCRGKAYHKRMKLYKEAQ